MGDGLRSILLLALLVLVAAPVLAQNALPSTAKSVRGHFTSLNKRLLDMAEDFPEAKYDFRLKPEMRTFGAVVVHVASGNIYAAKAGRRENVNWDELNPRITRPRQRLWRCRRSPSRTPMPHSKLRRTIHLPNYRTLDRSR